MTPPLPDTADSDDTSDLRPAASADHSAASADHSAADPGTPSSASDSALASVSSSAGAASSASSFADLVGDDELEDWETEEVINLHDGVRVSAVIVAHDGERWLPVALSALAAQERPLDTIVGIDTGSEDASGQLLIDALGSDAVLTLPRDAGFGTALARGVRHAGDADWIWVLHDDCAPRAEALRRLLDATVDRPAVAVVGPKVLGWADRTHLLEVGLTIARSGRRETGLEKHERDQGQHDQERDVLAVGSAGMLVRRDVWDQLGGFDEALPLFRDDIDFGWRATRAGHRVVVTPRAVVHHAEASARRRRSADAVERHPQRADRAHAMSVVLANSATWMVPLLTVRLLLGCLGRWIGFVVGKDGASARAEAGAAFDVFAHPGRMRAARARRRSLRAARDRDVARMLAPPGASTRQVLEAVGGVLTNARESSSPSTVLEAGPTDDSFDDLASDEPGVLGRLLRRPGVVATLVLALITVVAVRALVGSGRLLGGALLPAPDGVGTWWHDFTATWHPVSVGSPTPAPPTLPVLAALGLPTLGRAPSVVDLLVLLAVPLAFVSAYWCLAGLTRSTSLRLWAAASYALLPAVTGAIAAGRIGTLVVAMLLPPFARMAVHVSGLVSAPSMRAAWGTGLLLAVIGAFVPLIWLLALVLTVIAVATVVRERLARVRLAIVLLVPLVLWLPWTFRLVVDPQLFLLEAGAPAPDLADPALPAWSLLGLDPGGPGTPSWWLGIGIVLAALAALLRPARQREVRTAWIVAGVAWVVAAMLTLVTVTPPGSAPVAAWAGSATLVVGLVLLVAAVIGNDGVLRRLSAQGFSVWQAVAVVVTAMAVLAPVVYGLSWMARGAAEPIVRDDPELLPAFVAAQAQSPDRPRTLVLRTEPDRVAYALLRSTGPHLGDAEVVPQRDAVSDLDNLVADLASGRGGIESRRLASFAVRFVLVDAPVPAELADRLDAVPGLTRIGAPNGGVLWRVGPTSARVRFEPKGTTERIPMPAEEISARGGVPKDWAGGRIVMADQADRGWRASLNGKALTPVTVDGWAQGFELPEGSAGLVSITYSSSLRTFWLVVVGAVLVAVVILALPTRRRDEDEGHDA
jgi:GT2 family glycosyltransferase